MGAAFLRRDEGDVSVARFMLYSHHLAKLDRFVAQAGRRASRSGGEFAGVALEIDGSGAVSVHAPDMEPLLL